MGKIICRKCKLPKDEDSFAFEYKDLGIRKKVCRNCMRNYHINWYRDYRKKVGEKEWCRRQKVKIIRARTWKQNYLKNHPCVICRECDPVVLDFDHVVKEKYNKSSRLWNLIRNGYSTERLEKEALKCQILCANCHRKKTAKEHGWFKNF